MKAALLPIRMYLFDDVRATRFVFAGLLALSVTVANAGAITRSGQRLNLEGARSYLLKLINQDRERQGLKPVQLDPVAAVAGQRHAEEMAAYRFLSHWNRDGKMPDHRYTEAGGRDHDTENVYLTTRYRGGEPAPPLSLEPEPEFAESELEDIEEAYFNERPPYDGHRRNILDPKHTHVGIALARATRGDTASVLANTMEFVDRYAEFEPIPLQAKPGDRITVKGHTLAGSTLKSISIGRTECPKPMTREALLDTKSYHPPEPYVNYAVDSAFFAKMGKSLPDGRFEAEVILSDQGRSGVYYLTVWIVDSKGKLVPASQRTVLVP